MYSSIFNTFSLVNHAHLMDICEEKAICSNFNTFIGSSNYGLLLKLDLECGYWKFWNLEDDKTTRILGNINVKVLGISSLKINDHTCCNHP